VIWLFPAPAPLKESAPPVHLLDLDFVPLADQREMLRIALLKGGQKGIP